MNGERWDGRALQTWNPEELETNWVWREKKSRMILVWVVGGGFDQEKETGMFLQKDGRLGFRHLESFRYIGHPSGDERIYSASLCEEHSNWQSIDD